MPEPSRLAENAALLLDEARGALAELPAADYAGPEHDTTGGIGAQLRHCIDLWECLLRDLAGGDVIDYAKRERDPALERCPELGRARLTALADTLREHFASTPDRSVRVASEEGLLESSLARELDFLASHTVHHLAIVAVKLRLLDHPVPTTLGVAPATRAYRARAE